MDIRPLGVRIAVALVVALLDPLSAVPDALGQAAAGGGADGVVLQGRVLADDGSTTPLPGARVSVVSNGSAAAPVVSDGDGRFIVLAPARGGWSLRITKAGFAPADLGGDTLTEPLTIRLATGAVITGRVVDAYGESVAGVVIQAWPEQCPDTCETPVPLPVLAASVRTATTDDLGEYRIGSLPAGPREVWVGPSTTTLLAARQASTADLPEPDARVRLTPGHAIALSHVHTTAERSLSGTIAALEVGVATAGASAGARPDVIDRRGGSIRGRILDASRRPIAEASVLVQEIDTSATRIGRSDAAGRYEVIGLPAGRFYLTVSRAGHAPVRFGQRHASLQGTPIVLREYEAMDGFDIALPSPGVITGRVVDAHGEPIEGAHVRAWERRFADGRVTLAPAGASMVRTDDRGHYRVYGLLPGTYYVIARDASVVLPSQRGLVVQGTAGDSSAMRAELIRLEAIIAAAPRDDTPSVFHPASISAADAVPVRIEPGLDGHGVDITFAPPPMALVRGMVRDAAGQPSQGWVTLAVSARSGAPATPARRIPLGPFGSFEFPFVAPGDYVVHATTTDVALIPLGSTDALTRARTVTEVGMQFVTVTGADAADVSVRTSPGSRVRGRIVIEDGDDVPPPHASVMIGTLAPDADWTSTVDAGQPVALSQLQPRGVPAGDWTFEMTGLFGPRRFDLARAPQGWYLKSATVEGIDAAEHAFVFDGQDRSYGEVVVTLARGGTIGGQVVDDRSTPVREYSIIVFPTEPERWYFRSRYLRLARADQDGGFTVVGLPPGEYWVAAVDWIPGDTTFGEWQAPDRLSSLLPGARRVRVSGAQPATTELRLMVAPPW